MLGLASNRFAGELPIGGLGTLELIDLSGNGFNGSLPSDFGGARLRLLNVSSNKLAGAVPTELAALVPANATVDLSRNNFTARDPTGRPVRRAAGGGIRGQPEPVRAAAEAGMLHPVVALEPSQRHRLAAGVRGHPQEPRSCPAGSPEAAAAIH